MPTRCDPTDPGGTRRASFEARRAALMYKLVEPSSMVSESVDAMVEEATGLPPGTARGDGPRLFCRARGRPSDPGGLVPRAPDRLPAAEAVWRPGDTLMGSGRLALVLALLPRRPGRPLVARLTRRPPLPPMGRRVDMGGDTELVALPRVWRPPDR